MCVCANLSRFSEVLAEGEDIWKTNKLTPCSRASVSKKFPAFYEA